jgi:UDP-N-acetylmuramyl-tripeptide synthetase
MRLSELIDGIYNKPYPTSYRDFEVLTVSCDSREEQKDGLFVALPGFKFNGRDFIKDAMAKGAKIIVKQGITPCHPDPERSEGEGSLTNSNVCVLDVDDSKYFLHCIGQRFYGVPCDKIKTVGVTGTNGKTTVTYLIEAIIHAASRRCGVIGTVNYRIGTKIIPSKNTTPGFLDNQRYLAQLAGLGIDYCVMEASSHALDQGRLEGIHFSVGIFTNLTQDHLDYHKDMESYFKAKSLLFENLSSEAASVINVDDDYGKRLCLLTKSKIVTYAIDTPADVRAQNITYHLSGSQFEIVFPLGKIRIQTPFIGKYNIYNILAAFAWGISQDLNPEIVRRGIENLDHVPGRLEAVENNNGFFIFIDYAHTEDGLFNVLKSLRAVTSTKIILVFGCGGDRDRTKRPKMARMACTLADYTIVTTDNPRSEDPQAIINEVVVGFTKRNYETCVDREEAVGRALKMAQKDQIVLIAGKGHEDYQVFKDRTIAFNEREIIKECLQ